MRRLATTALALILAGSLPALGQSSDGGPQPGSDGIGVMPLPDPGKGPSPDGMTIGQPAGQVDPTVQADQAQQGTAPGTQPAQPGTAGTTGQGSTGQANAGQGSTGQGSSGQGGFVADGTGLGHTTDSSKPAPVPIQQGPRMETEKVAQAPGAVVRWLDKVSGKTVDITLSNGQAKTEGRLTIKLGQCRYPVSDPSSNAYAYLTIRDSLVDKPIFEGWMIASSPAIDPLDSPRYDVWLLHCTTS